MTRLTATRGVSTLTFGAIAIVTFQSTARALSLPDSGSCSLAAPSSCLSIAQSQQNSGFGLVVSSGGPAISGVGQFGNGVTGNVTATVVPTGYAGVYGVASSQYNRGVEGYNSSGGGLGVSGHVVGGGTGVGGVSVTGTGVSGFSTSGLGIYGQSDYSAIEGSTTGSTGTWLSGVYGQNTSTTNDGLGIAGRVWRSTSAAVFGDNTAGGWAGYFLGNVYVSGTVTQMSDARTKKDIADVPYGLRQLLQLRPVTYKWKGEAVDPAAQLGLIAQDLQKIVPETVRANERSGMLSINYTALIPVVIKAIQEQQAVVERQAARIAALEQARPSTASSLPTGGVGTGLALGLLPLGLVAGLRNRKKRQG